MSKKRVEQRGQRIGRKAAVGHKVEAHRAQCLECTEWLHEPVAKYADKCSACGRNKKEANVKSS
jgi:hypothetical protein